MAGLTLPSIFYKRNDWNIDKTLLIWKTISLAACIIGTILYYIPLEPYLEFPCFGILVPTFIIGYLVIVSTEILIMFAEEDYLFIEVCFNVIGAVASMACGLYEFYKWVTWMTEVSKPPDRDNNLSEFALAVALIVHSVSLAAVVVHLRQDIKAGFFHS